MDKVFKAERNIEKQDGFTTYTVTVDDKVFKNVNMIQLLDIIRNMEDDGK